MTMTFPDMSDICPQPQKEAAAALWSDVFEDEDEEKKKLKMNQSFRLK